MAEKASARCPHCRATLKLKSSAALGKRVSCPKCKQPFVIRPLTERTSAAPDDADEFSGLAELDLSDGEATAAPPPAVRGKRKRSPEERLRARAEAAAPAERSIAVRILSALVWLNAHLAVAVCVIDSAIEFVWMITHWDEFYRQAGLGRIAVRQLARPVFVIITAGIVWFQGVLPRDIGMRKVVAVFGGAYLFLFGLVAAIIVLLSGSVYGEAMYEIQWSVVYLGVSLLVYSVWGYPPETPLQKAERLTSSGRYSEALTAVNLVLQQDPVNPDALELQRALRDMMRYG